MFVVVVVEEAPPKLKATVCRAWARSEARYHESPLSVIVIVELPYVTVMLTLSFTWNALNVVPSIVRESVPITSIRHLPDEDPNGAALAVRS